jgi:hypothetical protein
MATTHTRKTSCVVYLREKLNLACSAALFGALCQGMPASLALLPEQYATGNSTPRPRRSQNHKLTQVMPAAETIPAMAKERLPVNQTVMALAQFTQHAGALQPNVNETALRIHLQRTVGA